ncbi:hypothetical protein [Polyangium jinanense]|uniref:Uncharacterized protein n=1 Tax=Polyangium jinanense TaxID=2829994 RepID=A0A9X3X2U5_9BACT|nr:hypothetical protein [Polyangium jinanense]MDC3955179.1 hypothetical protein [Polyangium jinanense]MDC3981480.1 hypothetical protein [Polyangium jinanense]
MTTTGLLDLGASEIVDRNTGELLGYAFTVESGKGQLQRWLLFRHPQNELEIRPPAPAMATWSLADWQANVPSLWRPNGFYVWAQADVYRHGETYDGVTWAQIPSVSQLPKPTFPELPGSNYQLDYTGKVADVLQENWRGRAFVVRGLTQASSIEYWSLPARYQPAGSRGTTTVTVGTEEASSLDAFVEHSNRTWSTGSTFVITGCANYHGSATPFAP